ncbi:MAG TPA: hypothetical protein VMY05_02370 [Acidobacteriota bacterium]|nr:hypothetical protein [Acidobacteriota bacterium]
MNAKKIPSLFIFFLTWFSLMICFRANVSYGGCSMRKAKRAKKKVVKKKATKRKVTAKKKTASKKKVAVKRKVVKRKAAPKRKSAKVRCSGKTKAGKRCRRYTDGKSKHCALHR